MTGGPAIGAPTDNEMYERMVCAILDHRLPPGTKLVEDRLASAFGVSRTRVRPVLMRLANEQVVTLVPNRGATIAQPGQEEAREVFEARRLIEPRLVELFIARADKADIRRLKACIDDEAAARLAGDFRRAIRLAGDFHLSLAERAGQRTLGRILRELISRTSLILMTCGSDRVAGPERTRACGCSDHSTLLNAIGLRDAPQAARCMRDHLIRLEAGLRFSVAADPVPDLAELFGPGAEPMRQLLVINPNTSTAMSELLHRHVQAAAAIGANVRTVTARFGAPYIADEASYAVAAHAALDAWAAALAAARVEGDSAPCAVLIGCFGDPGLLALRESSPVPVSGLAEAAFAEAAEHGRFAVVTGGQRWGPMLQRLAQALGHGLALAGIHTVAPTGAQLAANPAGARVLLARACQEAARQFSVRTVIVGGAGLAGVAAAIQPGLDVALIDSVLAGARWALRQPDHADPAARAGFDVRWENLSPELTALGRNR